MRKLKVWDQVIVISGKHKWKVSKILKIKDKRKWKTNVINTYVYLDGVNVAKKAVKWKGFVDVVLPIHISNVAYYDESSKSKSRIGFVVDKDWKKTRILKKTWKKVN